MAAAARAAGKPIICDVELLARAQPNARFVGITGTNGKSTTTALIGHILKNAGVACEVGGNIGRGALDLAPLGTGGIYVLELSSYQLELLETFRAHVAVLAQHHARPHRPAWRHRGLCRRQGAYLRSPAAGRLRRHRHRRRAVALGLRQDRPPLPHRLRAGGARPAGRGRHLLPRRHAGRRRRLLGRLLGRADATRRPQCPERRLRLGGLPVASGDARPDRGRAANPIPACRTARSRSPRSATSSTSTTARRPTPTPRRALCRAIATSTGSSAARRRRAAWRRSRRGSSASATPS